MKLLLVSGIYPPDIGGPATFTQNLKNLLISEKHSVKVITLGDSNKYYFETDEACIERINRRIPKLIRFFIVAFKIRRNAKKVDLVFSTGLHEETAFGLIGKKLNRICKVVGDPVWERAVNLKLTNSDIDIFNMQFKKANLFLKLHRFIFIKSLNRFDLVLTPGRNLLKLLQTWNVKSKLLFLPNAIVIKEEKLINDSTRANSIIVVSRLVKWKRIELAIELSSLLELELTIVGDGPERNLLEQTAREKSLNVQFLGSLDPNAVIQELNKSRIYVLLSNYEGMSYSLLEAMGLGMLVVVSDIESNREIVRHLETGFIFDVNNFDQSLNELKKLLIDRDKIDFITANARNFVTRNHNLQNQLKLLLELVK